LQNTRVLVSFLVRAVVVGLAVAFLVVWWNPKLLGAHTAAVAPAVIAAPPPQAVAPAPSVVMQSFADVRPVDALLALIDKAPT